MSRQVGVLGCEGLEVILMCSLERRLEWASELNLLGGPEETFVQPGRGLVSSAMMRIHQGATIPGGYIVCCKSAGLLLLGDPCNCSVWRRY